MKDIILYSCCGGAVVIAIVLFIIAMITFSKAKEKHQSSAENVEEAKKLASKTSNPADNKIIVDLRLENERLLAANKALMQSNIELSAGTSNSADYSRFKNEVEDLKTKISRMQVHEEELEAELKEKKQILSTYEGTDFESMRKDIEDKITENMNLQAEIQRLNDMLDDESREAIIKNDPSDDALDRANDMYNRLYTEHQMLVVDYNELSKKYQELENELSELKTKATSNNAVQYVCERISVLAEDAITKAIADETKILDEMMSLKRNQLYVYAKLLGIKNYSKMKNKDLVAEIYKALRCK